VKRRSSVLLAAAVLLQTWLTPPADAGAAMAPAAAKGARDARGHSAWMTEVRNGGELVADAFPARDHAAAPFDVVVTMRHRYAGRS
jgi:hypothetical protein